MARIYTLAGIVNLLRSNGFEVKKTCYMTAPMDVIPWPAIQKLMRNVIFRGNTDTSPQSLHRDIRPLPETLCMIMTAP